MMKGPIPEQKNIQYIFQTLSISNKLLNPQKNAEAYVGSKWHPGNYFTAVQCRVTFTPRDNLESSCDLKCISLDCGRKVSVENMHDQNIEILHIKVPAQTKRRFFLL